MSFESFALDARVRAGIQSAGYTEPTPIQLQSIPPILAGRDLLGIAQTGTGKTAAFMLPILQRLLAQPGRGVRALILAPTRELAEQIHQATRRLWKAHRRAQRGDLRRRRQEAAGGRAAPRRRRRRRLPWPPARPGRRAQPRSVEGRSAGAGRGRPDVRHGLPARHPPHPQAGAGSAPDPVLLGHDAGRDPRAGRRHPARSGHRSNRTERAAQVDFACAVSGVAAG